MHKLSIILLYLILCICSCSSVKENNKLYEEGVSKQLAVLRKENIPKIRKQSQWQSQLQ